MSRPRNGGEVAAEGALVDADGARRRWRAGHRSGAAARHLLRNGVYLAAEDGYDGLQVAAVCLAIG